MSTSALGVKVKSWGRAEKTILCVCERDFSQFPWLLLMTLFSHFPKALFFFTCGIYLVVAHSDEFGRNPQHDFGSVSGRITNPVLPFWTMLGTPLQPIHLDYFPHLVWPLGDAFANEDVVRLTPDRQSKTGAVWNSQRLMWDNWEVLVRMDTRHSFLFLSAFLLIRLNSMFMASVLLAPMGLHFGLLVR